MASSKFYRICNYLNRQHHITIPDCSMFFIMYRKFIKCNKNVPENRMEFTVYPRFLGYYTFESAVIIIIWHILQH